MTATEQDWKKARLTEESLLRFDPDETAADYPRTTLAAFVAVTIIYVAMRLRGLTSAPLGFDEVFSLRAARQSWREMFAIITDDMVHPPLFYVLLKIWIGVGGQSPTWVRLLPVTLAILALPPFVVFCRELGASLRATTLALALMGVNTYLIAYAQELRMYSLLMLLTICSLLCFVRFFNSCAREATLPLLLLTATNLLLVSAHYYAWVIVIIEFVFLFTRGRRKLIGFTLSTLFIVLCYAPWFYVVARAPFSTQSGRMSQSLTWLPRPSLVNFFGFYAALTGAVPYLWRQSLRLLCSVVTLLLFAAPSLLLLWREIMRRRTPASPTVFLAVTAFAPALMVFFASIILPRSIWHQRYLIIVAVPYILLVAIGLDRLRPKILRLFVITLALAWTAFAGFNEPGYSEKFAWQEVAEKLRAAEASPQQITVYARGGMIALPLRYYLAELGDTRFQVIRKDDLQALEGERFWFSYRATLANERQSPQEILRQRGFIIGTNIETIGTTQSKIIMFPVERASTEKQGQ